LTGTELAHQARAAVARGISLIFGKKNSCIARARRGAARAFGSLPSQDPDPGRCLLYSSAGSSKIKIRTSSPYKARLGLYGDEVRILIFDYPAEL
jgi:hypothetical protein